MQYLNILKKQLESLNLDSTGATESVDTTGCDQFSMQFNMTEVSPDGGAVYQMQKSLDDSTWEDDGNPVAGVPDAVVFLAATQPLDGNYYRSFITITGGGETDIDVFVLGKGFV